MFNIRIKGKYKNEEQLIHGKELPTGAVQFKEGETIREAFNLGFLLSLPIMIPMIAISIVRCSKMEKQLEFGVSFVVAAVITLLLGQILTYVHEFIHAIFYPKEAEKDIWKDSSQGAYFVYCDARVSKCKFIVLCLAPCVILGIVPFAIWYMIAPLLNVEWVIWIMVLTWMLTFMSMGDFANAYNAIKQVPKDAKIFNYGMHSYWIIE